MVGLLGGVIGIRWSLGLSALALVIADVALLAYVYRGRRLAVGELPENEALVR
jgi:hypothetical protein